MFPWTNSSNRSFRRYSIVIALTLHLYMPICAVASPEDEQLENFLTRLGLIELQTVHMEKALVAEADKAKRLRLAQRLADVYAGQLLSFSDNAKKYEAVTQKINNLLDQVPAAKTSLLEVMLLQADYDRAEGLVGKWIADRSDASSLATSQSILDRITPELNRLRRELNVKFEKLLEEINKLDEGEQLTRKEKELNRLQAIVGRASYYAAWSSYYRGLTRKSNVDYEIALKTFRELLAIGDSYEDVDAEFLGLGSIWRARSLIGLALTEAALNHQAESDRCFELLNDGSVPPQLRDQVGYWRLRSLLNVERYADAVAFAEEQIAGFKGTATQGQVSFCVTLIQAAYAGRVVADNEFKRLGELGLGGLIKIGQRSMARQLMKKHEIQLDDNAGFYLLWMQGQQLFDHAEQSKKPEDYAKAKASLARALRDPTAENDLRSAGQCRNQLAWCQYRQGDYDAAGREFRMAAERLIAARDKQAVDAAWMAFVAYQSASKSAARFKEAAIDMLNMIKREFPTHEYAKRADYYIGKLRQGTSPAETLQSLEKVASDSPDYLSARYEITSILYRQWKKAAAGEKDTIARKLFAATDAYSTSASSESDKSRTVRSLSQAADVALNGAKTNLSVAEKYLKRANALVGSLASSSSSAAQYYFRAMQLAKRQGNALQERLHADWLVKHASGSRYELAAIIVMARTMDKKIAASASASSGSSTDIQQAFDLYQRLVQLLGDTPEAIRASKNTRVANSKLEAYATRLGKHDIAAQRMNSLLAATDGTPSENYLRRAGLANFAAKDYAASIRQWRTLVRALKKGSDKWFEAKYHQLACLFQIDRTKARIAYDQFKLLYPDLGQDAWRDKFEALR